MQLTAPLFLFLFLPLSLLPLPFCPPRYRKGVLTALSLVYFLFLHRASPLSLLPIGGVVLLCCLLSALPDRAPRLRCAVGVILPLAALLAARLLAEYAPFDYQYPTGLTMVVLSAVSVAIDRYRGDAPEREGPFAVISYLLFYPTLLIGPLLRYKQFLYVTERIRPSRERFSQGALLFMSGYVKRIAVAAVLVRMLTPLLALHAAALPLSVVLLLLLLALTFLYAFITGTTDMARGVMAMFGIQPPRAQCDSVPLLLPHRLLFSLLLPFERYLEDYVARPVRQRLGGTRGKLLATLLPLLCTLLLLRTRPEALLLALPLFLTALLSLHRPRYRRTPRHVLLRAPLALLCFALLSLFSLGVLLDNPLSLFSLFTRALDGTPTYSLQYLFGAAFDSRYLWCVAAFLILSLLAHGTRVCQKRLPQRLVFVLRCILAALVCLAFLATLFYFMPQFPRYADPVYGAPLLR